MPELSCKCLSYSVNRLSCVYMTSDILGDLPKSLWVWLSCCCPSKQELNIEHYWESTYQVCNSVLKRGGVESSLQRRMIKRDDSCTHICTPFAKVAHYCFEKKSSVILCKNVIAEYFNLFCLCFSQVELYCYYLKKIFSAKQVNCRQNKLFFAKNVLLFTHICILIKWLKNY